ncbi:hypothetical protein KC19_4G068400 [Ceratodon purpureus]|uniref:Uncharacterized protein n=1 Tax=Ceratodon purpureus TaxID=3225 RepID=A0A8T0I7I3_CERPU|nr:hypothetical protein KC19_4G068400 [Ceratodon purpureus]
MPAWKDYHIRHKGWACIRGSSSSSSDFGGLVFPVFVLAGELARLVLAGVLARLGAGSFSGFLKWLGLGFGALCIEDLRMAESLHYSGYGLRHRFAGVSNGVAIALAHMNRVDTVCFLLCFVDARFQSCDCVPSKWPPAEVDTWLMFLILQVVAVAGFLEDVAKCVYSFLKSLFQRAPTFSKHLRPLRL